MVHAEGAEGVRRRRSSPLRRPHAGGGRPPRAPSPVRDARVGSRGSQAVGVSIALGGTSSATSADDGGQRDEARARQRMVSAPLCVLGVNQEASGQRCRIDVPMCSWSRRVAGRQHAPRGAGTTRGGVRAPCGAGLPRVDQWPATAAHRQSCPPRRRIPRRRIPRRWGRWPAHPSIDIDAWPVSRLTPPARCCVRTDLTPGKLRPSPLDRAPGSGRPTGYGCANCTSPAPPPLAVVHVS